MKDKWRAYRQRDEQLLLLGFPSYAAYLASPLWAGIRLAVFNVKGSQCVVCSKAAAVCHHRDYRPETLRGEDMSDILPLCHGCHRFIEFNRQGQKVPLGRTNKALKLLTKIVNKRKRRAARRKR